MQYGYGYTPDRVTARVPLQLLSHSITIIAHCHSTMPPRSQQITISASKEVQSHANLPRVRCGRHSHRKKDCLRGRLSVRERERDRASMHMFCATNSFTFFIMKKKFEMRRYRHRQTVGHVLYAPVTRLVGTTHNKRKKKVGDPRDDMLRCSC